MNNDKTKKTKQQQRRIQHKLQTQNKNHIKPKRVVLMIQKHTKEIDLILSIDENDKSKGNLFLGSVYGADSIKVRNNNHIRSVLSVGGDPESMVQYNNEQYTHTTLPAFDHPRFNISSLFEVGIQFIAEQLKTTNVLVHCFAGVSRSSSIVIAYLIKVHQMTFNDAFAFTKSKRSIVSPNAGFMEQLKLYEQQQLKDLKAE